MAPQAARQAVTHCLIGTGIVLLSLFLLEDVHLLSTGFGARIDVMGARLVVFCLTQALLIYLLDRPWALPTVLSVPVILVVVMIFDTMIFYPIVFLPRFAARTVAGFAVVSIATRIIVTLFAMPMLAVCLHLHRKRTSMLTSPAGDIGLSMNHQRARSVVIQLLLVMLMGSCACFSGSVMAQVANAPQCGIILSGALGGMGGFGFEFLLKRLRHRATT